MNGALLQVAKRAWSRLFNVRGNASIKRHGETRIRDLPTHGVGGVGNALRLAWANGNRIGAANCKVDLANMQATRSQSAVMGEPGLCVEEQTQWRLAASTNTLSGTFMKRSSVLRRFPFHTS